eukprot:CAMPEP_0176377410 /NCGR_PEP_ID=MMETSP0126-20121128/28871_1 /TAXON_ID=141414 ORGANISM="Strombidinopsis acuminatum, Strain SPMC142" /NCGR_SAMPLE_ID=MMETSP0126 /ASSEMBLY_ACC=CAM_ASM_000229 /LENGTH=149 /DNA_ID=CAMNT_0017739241 /DNA_START=1587 /DNA_END=2036 /DNA_ORIENTATION=+
MTMMKYVTNHRDDFKFPIMAYFIGIMQFIGGLFTEILCILYIATQSSTIATIIKFLALGVIANVDNFYASALPDSYPLKQKSDPLPIKVVNGDPCTRNRSCCTKIMRYIYKFIRAFYCSILFYYMPYLAIFTPFFNNTSYGNWEKCYNV